MYHGQRAEYYFLVCWLACRDCLRDTVLDGYAIFLFVCLVNGWMDGWIDGWMDGWMGWAQRYEMGGFGCLVCWLLGGFVGLAALSLG